MSDSNHMCGKSSGDTPVFFPFRVLSSIVESYLKEKTSVHGYEKKKEKIAIYFSKEFFFLSRITY